MNKESFDCSSKLKILAAVQIFVSESANAYLGPSLGFGASTLILIILFFILISLLVLIGVPFIRFVKKIRWKK